MKLPTLLVCDASLEKRQSIEELIYAQPSLSLVGTVSRALAAEQVGSLHPSLVWIELGPAPVRGLSLLAELKESFPEVSFFTSYDVPDPELIRTAYRLGASDFLDAERWSTDLPAAVQSLQLKHKSESVTNNIGKCICLFSPTGGVGLSTIATNLAGYLAKYADTCLLDLDLQFGMVGNYLNLEPAFTLGSLDSSHASFDGAYLRNLMTKYNDHLSVLPAPNKPDEMGELSASQTQEMLTTLKQEFRHTVVDLPKNLLDERSIAALDTSDYILLLTEYHWSAVLNARKCLDIFKAHYAPDKLLLVVNRTEWLPQDVLNECRANLNCPVYAEIPNDAKTARWGNNQGQLAPPHTQFGKALDSLAKRLSPVEQPVESAHGTDAGFAGFKLPAIFSRHNK